MAWYKNGTVKLTNGNAVVTGAGTSWADNKMGIGPGQMLLVPGAGTVQMYEILRVDSNTQLILASNFNGITAAASAYAIPSFYVDSVPDFSRRLAAQLSYYQSQMDGWQQIMTGSGSVSITAPDGTVVNISSFAKLTSDMSNKATLVSGAVPVNQGGTGSTTGDGACSNIGALPKSGGTMTGPLIMNGSSVISAQGGVEVNLAAGLLLKGKVQQGAGRDNNLIAISGDGSTPNTGFVNALQYNWYADGWILGVIRGSGTNTLGYSIYYNGAAYGASKLWNFNYDGSATSSGAWVNGSDERHKSNILPVDNALSAVLSWRGATYDVKDGGQGVGLVAQDVEKNCPRAVKAYGDRTFSDGTVIEGFKYLDTSGAAAAYHTEAIKQLFKLVELALYDPDACRAQIAAIKKVMIETTAEPAS